MTLIDLGDFKLRFDPKEIRINIDGETIDVGARSIIDEEKPIMNLTWNGETKSYSQEDIQDFFDRTSELKQLAKKIREELNDKKGESQFVNNIKEDIIKTTGSYSNDKTIDCEKNTLKDPIMKKISDLQLFL